MKNLITVCSLVIFGLNANSYTAADQVAGLQNAGLQEVDAGLFVRGNIAVLVNPNGDIDPYVPFDRYLNAETTKAIRVGKLFNGETDSLQYLYVDPRHGEQSIERSENGSGGGLNKIKVEKLKELVGQPLNQQLTAAGFSAVGNKNTVWRRMLGDSPVLVVLEKNILKGVYKNARQIANKTKGATVIGYSEGLNDYGHSISALRFENALSRFSFVSDYVERISNVEIIKDLKDVALNELGLVLPEAKKDSASDFKIGGSNLTDIILNLLSLNGSSISQIEEEAREVDGCSSGDKLLAERESLVDVMAQDNEKVKRLNLTHQELALPLLYAQAVTDGSYGNMFSLHGTNFSVSQSPTPMCGSLNSPFNDKYSKPITFFTIKNLKTNREVKYSYLHPYMINQYGFYGSHQNRSYVDPNTLVEVFEYLKK